GHVADGEAGEDAEEEDGADEEGEGPAMLHGGGVEGTLGAPAGARRRRGEADEPTRGPRRFVPYGRFGSKVLAARHGAPPPGRVRKRAATSSLLRSGGEFAPPGGSGPAC